MHKRLFLVLLLVILIVLPAQAELRPEQNESDPLIIDPEPIAYIGDTPYSVAHANGYAYVGLGSRIATFDLHDPYNPEKLGETQSLGAGIGQILVDDGHLYARLGDGALCVLTLADPANPAELARCEVAENLYIMHLHEGWIYALSDTSLWTVDIHKPDEPIVSRNPLVIPNCADLIPVVSVDQGVLYLHSLVTDYDSGYEEKLVIRVDVKQPDQPVLMDVREPEDRFWLLGATGNLAFTDAQEGVRIIDLASEAFETIGVVDIGRLALAVAVGDDMLWCQSSGDSYSDPGRLYAVDISDPTAPVNLGALDPSHLNKDCPWWSRTTTVSEGLLLQTFGGLWVIDVSDPVKMAEAAHVSASLQSGWSSVTGDVLLHNQVALLVSDDQIRAIDLSDPADPVSVYQTDASGIAPEQASLLLDGRLAWTSDSGKPDTIDLSLLEISDGSCVTESLPMIGTVVDIAGTGSTLALACGENGVYLVDVSDATSPSVLSHIAIDAQVLAGSDTTLYAGHSQYGPWDNASGKITIVDISNPRVPVSVGEVEVARSDISDLDIHADTLISLGNSLERGGPLLTLWSIADVANPQPISTHRFGDNGRAERLALVPGHVLAFGYGYGTGYGHGCIAIDISDPSSPQLAPQYLDGYLTHKGSIALLDAGTDGLTVHRASGASFTWSQEAEEAVITAPMSIHQDPDDSGGAYVSSPSPNGAVMFEIDVPVTGEYYIWSRVQGTGYTSNSFFVSIDGGPESTYEIPPFDDGWVWGWHQTYADALGAPPFWLEAGTHSLTFAAREANTRLDRVTIGDDPWFVPEQPAPVVPTPSPTITPKPTPGDPQNGDLPLLTRLFSEYGDPVLRDGLAYIPTGSRLTVWDIGNTAQPRLVGESPSVGGSITRCWLDDSTAFLVAQVDDAPHIVSIDISDPTQPTVLDSLAMGGWCAGGTSLDDAIKNGDVIYAGIFAAAGHCSYGALVTVDVSDPTALKEASPRVRVEVAPDGFGQQTPDEHLYVRYSWSDSMYVFDVHDPTIPRFERYLDIGGRFCEQDDYLYVASWPEFQVVDCRDLENPSVVATLEVEARGNPHIVDGLLEVPEEDLVAVFDISEPANPIFIERRDPVPLPADSLRLPTIPQPERMSVEGSMVLYTTGRELISLDLSDATSPQILDRLELSAWPWQLVRDGSTLYIIEDAFTIEAIDTSLPTSLQHVGMVEFEDSVCAMDIAGGYAVTADSEGLMHVFDVTGLISATEIASLRIWDNDSVSGEAFVPMSVQLSDGLVYVGATYGRHDGILVVIDLSNVGAPRVLARLDRRVSGMWLDDGHLVTKQSFPLSYYYAPREPELVDVWDLTDPAQPELMSSTTLNAPQGGVSSVRDVVFSRDHTYLAAQVTSSSDFPCDLGGALFALDTSDPGCLERVASRRTGDLPIDLAISGQRLFSSEWRDGLAIYGIEEDVDEWHEFLPYVLR